MSVGEGVAVTSEDAVAVSLLVLVTTVAVSHVHAIEARVSEAEKKNAVQQVQIDVLTGKVERLERIDREQRGLGP